MNNEKTVGGVHVQDRGNRALPTDIVKALKSQDENYLRTKRARDRKVSPCSAPAILFIHT